jgi:hypothetical protein
MSYAGHATLAVIADARLVPDPEAITVGFNREFARMLKAVRRPQSATAPLKAGGRRVRVRSS